MRCEALRVRLVDALYGIEVTPGVVVDIPSVQENFRCARMID
jgi:hypothetical protein